MICYFSFFFSFCLAKQFSQTKTKNYRTESEKRPTKFKAISSSNRITFVILQFVPKHWFQTNLNRFIFSAIVFQYFLRFDRKMTHNLFISMLMNFSDCINFDTWYTNAARRAAAYSTQCLITYPFLIIHYNCNQSRNDQIVI